MQKVASPSVFDLRSFLIATASLLCFAVIGGGSLSAATFAPTRVESEALRQRSEATLNLEGLQAQIDGQGRRFYQIDDARYLAETVETENAFTGANWPGGIVYYQFAPSVPSNQRAVWRTAGAAWSAVAPVTFVERSGPGNVIYVQQSSGNNSYIGMIGGRQEMNLSEWAHKVIVHEIGHALGLEHEQCRADRDSYVTINYGNIMAGFTSNFDRSGHAVSYGAYDFASIMHYPRLAWSSNGQNTIVPLPPYAAYLYTMGEATNISALDASGMAARYNGTPVPGPANDHFANRTALSGHSGSISGNNIGATVEAGEPQTNLGRSVWYTWSFPEAVQVTLDTFGSDFDTMVGVYGGNTVSGLNFLAENDDSDGTLQSTVVFEAVPNVSYQIRVGGYQSAAGNITLNWRVDTGRSDLSGDGKADLVWQDNSTGGRSIWVMDGITKTEERSLGTVPLQWQIAGLGLFHGGRQMDIVWQNMTTGQRTIWLMTGTVRTGDISLPTVPTSWQIAATGDFNGDERTDLVWQNTQTGQRVVWLMNGSNPRLGDRVLPTVPVQWKIAGTGDFNSDGRVDLLWQNNSTGQRAVWFMDGTTKIGDRYLPTVATFWQIAGTGDFNNDDQVDIIWQNISSGQRAIWLMNGTTRIGDRYLPSAATQLEIRNH